MVKEYGLDNEALSGNKPKKGMPLVLDDRLPSKQYIKNKVDGKVSNDAFDATWDAVEDVAPSKNAVYDKINSLSAVGDAFTREDDTSSSNVRANKTGNYAIGPANFTGKADWDKLYVSGGNIKTTGNYIMQNNGSTIGPSSGELTLDSSNGAKVATKFAVGSTNPSVPLEVNLAGSTANLNDGTGIVQVGADGGANLAIDGNKIQARDSSGGSAAGAQLNLNTSGGAVSIGSDGVTTTINGNLNVIGTATTTLSETVNIKDSFVLLNSDQTGTSDANAGIEVERGDLTNVAIRWNGTDDAWQTTLNGSDYYNILTTNTGGTINQLGTNTASALSLSTTTNTNDTINLADKFVQHAGDSMTGALTIGSSGDQTSNSGAGATMLTVFGGPSTGNAALTVNGHLKADTKSFDIPHPIKKNMRLVHGTLEGPEFGMYQRGTIVKSHLPTEEVPLPAYWGKLVADYTVSLTPHGNYNVWLVEKHKNMFEIKSNADAINGPWSCDWIVIGRRNDYPLEVEQ